MKLQVILPLLFWVFSSGTAFSKVKADSETAIHTTTQDSKPRTVDDTPKTPYMPRDIGDFSRCLSAGRAWKEYKGIRLVAALIKNKKGRIEPADEGDPNGQCALLAVEEGVVIGSVQTRHELDNTNMYTILPGEMSGEKGNVFMLPSLDPQREPQALEVTCSLQDSDIQLALFSAEDGSPFMRYFDKKKNRKKVAENPDT